MCCYFQIRLSVLDHLKNAPNGNYGKSHTIKCHLISFCVTMTPLYLRHAPARPEPELYGGLGIVLVHQGHVEVIHKMLKRSVSVSSQSECGIFACSGRGRHHSNTPGRGQVDHDSGSVSGHGRLPGAKGGHLHQAA